MAVGIQSTLFDDGKSANNSIDVALMYGLKSSQKPGFFTRPGRRSLINEG